MTRRSYQHLAALSDFGFDARVLKEQVEQVPLEFHIHVGSSRR